MNQETWRQVTELTADALELPSSERREFLLNSSQDECIVSNALRLIAEYENANESFLKPIARLFPEVPKSESLRLTLNIGDVILERFRIDRFIAKGGMGEVYEIWDLDMREAYALKTIRPEIVSDHRVLQKFKDEVKQALKISHKNVCRVHNLFTFQDKQGEHHACLVMELLEGETLAQRISRRGPLNPNEALPLAMQIVAGVAAAHEVNVIHRDLKSSNIMLVPQGHGIRAVVTDFGLASPAGLEGVTDVEGTPAYMAPEQLKGEMANPAADQYALGVVLFEMVTGRLPFAGSTNTQIALRRLSEAAPSPRTFSPKLPKRWERTILRCLCLEPANRFANVNEIGEELGPPRRRTTVLAFAAASIVILIATLGIIGWHAGGQVITDIRQITPGSDVSDAPSLSADGSVIAYESDRSGNGNTDIWIEDLRAHQAPRRLTTDAAEDHDASLSPDGKVVAFRSERLGGGIYIVNTDGTGEHLLVPGGRNPRFSPDGGKIAYWIGELDTTKPSAKSFVIEVTGGASQQLLPKFADVRAPMWNSETMMLLAEACLDASRPLFSCSDWWATKVGSPTGENTHGIERLMAFRLRPLGSVYEWSKRRIYVTAYFGSEARTVSLKLDRNYQASSSPEILTSGDAEIDYFSLAKTGRVALSRVVPSIHVWEFSTSPQKRGLKRVTDDADMDCSPSASGDGKRIVFARGFDRIELTNLVSHETSTVARLTSDQTPEWRLATPVIDQKGSRTAFERRGPNGSELLVVDNEGRILAKCNRCGTPTGWLADSGQVLFTTQEASSRVGIFDTSRSQTSILLASPGVSLDQAQWSQDNEVLLFTASRSERVKQVYAVRCLKSGEIQGVWIPVTSAAEWSDKPRWGASGKSVYFLSNRDGHYCLWMQQCNRGLKPGQLLEVQSFHSSRLSPGFVYMSSFNVSVVQDKIFLNPGENASSVLIGHLQTKWDSFLSRVRGL